MPVLLLVKKLRYDILIKCEIGATYLQFARKCTTSTSFTVSLSFDNFRLTPSKNKRSMGHNAHLRKTVQIDEHQWLSQCWLREQKTHYILMRIEGFFFRTNFNPLHQRMHCGRIGWYWPIGSGIEDFSILSMYFSISFLSPLGKGRGASFGQTWIPSAKDALCNVWLKLAQWFWWRRFLKFVKVFLLFRYIISPWKKAGPSLIKMNSPSAKDALCQVWLKLAQWFWRRRFLKFVNVFKMKWLNYF